MTQDIPQYKIAQFNSRHDVTEDQQFKALVEEVGELSEALNTEAGDDAVAEELADIIFVARSLAELRDINITSELVETIAENSEKDESISRLQEVASVSDVHSKSETDGQKVTKQTQ